MKRTLITNRRAVWYRDDCRSQTDMAATKRILCAYHTFSLSFSEISSKKNPTQRASSLSFDDTMHRNLTYS